MVPPIPWSPTWKVTGRLSFPAPTVPILSLRLSPWTPWIPAQALQHGLPSPSATLPAGPSSLLRNEPSTPSSASWAATSTTSRTSSSSSPSTSPTTSSPAKSSQLNVGGLTLTPPEISAYILLQLKSNAERFFGAEVTKAVITVPAYFNDAQRQATKDAGRIAGLDVLRLVNEPTAAALAYGLDRAKDGIIAVYDFGGGTFDISILKLHEGIFEVIATGGDTHLGGDDIDNLLIAVALDDIRGDLGVDLRQHPEAIQALRKAVIEAKIALSTEPTQRDIDSSLCPTADHYQREITRAQFEQLIAPSSPAPPPPVKQALKDAGIAS